MVCRRKLTEAYRARRDNLEVGVARGQELRVDPVTLVRVHDAHAMDIRVGEMLEHPFP